MSTYCLLASFFFLNESCSARSEFSESFNVDSEHCSALSEFSGSFNVDSGQCSAPSKFNESSNVDSEWLMLLEDKIYLKHILSSIPSF